MCPNPSHFKILKRERWKQTLSKVGRTARNLCPSGYGILAHQCDQGSFARASSFVALTTEKGQNTVTFL